METGRKIQNIVHREQAKITGKKVVKANKPAGILAQYKLHNHIYIVICTVHTRVRSILTPWLSACPTATEDAGRPGTTANVGKTAKLSLFSYRNLKSFLGEQPTKKRNI